MKTRIEEAFQEWFQVRFSEIEFENEEMYFSCKYENNQAFIAGAEFMQKEAESWKTFVEGLTKDLMFHQNLNKEKFEEIKKLKADNEFQASVMVDMGGIILENEKLKAQLEKAEGVIRFYAEYKFDTNLGGKKAREYFEGKETK
jgi:hypothetical protein